MKRVYSQIETALRVALAAAALGGVCASNSSFAAGAAEVDDAAARMQYAFYTADARTLREVQGELLRLEVPPQLEAIKAYYLGFAEWKSWQLLNETGRDPAPAADNRSQALKSAQACERHMQTARTHDVRFAEAYALEALCASLPATMRAATARPAASSCARSKGLRTALALEPNNPRIRLIELLCQVAPDAAAVEQVAQLRQVTAAFDTAPAAGATRPDWGQPEALLLLGQAHLRRGESLAAREALEKALVLSPDYRAAQDLLQRSTVAPR